MVHKKSWKESNLPRAKQYAVFIYFYLSVFQLIECDTFTVNFKLTYNLNSFPDMKFICQTFKYFINRPICVWSGAPYQ